MSLVENLRNIGMEVAEQVKTSVDDAYNNIQTAIEEMQGRDPQDILNETISSLQSNLDQSVGNLADLRDKADELFQNNFSGVSANLEELKAKLPAGMDLETLRNQLDQFIFEAQDKISEAVTNLQTALPQLNLDEIRERITALVNRNQNQ